MSGYINRGRARTQTARNIHIVHAPESSSVAASNMPHETNAADDNPPPLPSPPFITVDGIANFRDAGGYAILPSVTNNSITPSPSPSSTPQSIRPHPNAPASIRPHYLYRSADPSRITPSGKTTIQNLGITHLFDLRSAPEIEKQKASGQPVQTIEGVERRETPAFATQDYSPQAIAGRYRDYASGEFEVCNPLDLFLRFCVFSVRCDRQGGLTSL